VGRPRAAVRRKLVRTHISERYQADDDHRFFDQAAARYDGEIELAHDLARIRLPARVRVGGD
jgi:ribonuclease Z